MIRTLIPALCLVFATAASAEPTPRAQTAAQTRNAVIPFSSHGGVTRWRADGPGAILLQSRGGRWYRGEFRGACPEVRASEAVGYTTNAGGAIDIHSKLFIRDRVCRLRSLTEAANPLKTRTG
jgi:hypothetical protein